MLRNYRRTVCFLVFPMGLSLFFLGSMMSHGRSTMTTQPETEVTGKFKQLTEEV